MIIIYRGEFMIGVGAGVEICVDDGTLLTIWLELSSLVLFLYQQQCQNML